MIFDHPSRVVLLVGGTEVASWPLSRPARVDLGTVDELARLQLAARRAGCEIRVRGVCRELIELLDLVGLGYLVAPGFGRAIGSEVCGQPEVLEQRGVEEVVEPDDPVA